MNFDTIKEYFKKKIKKPETPFTAEKAWIETTYGLGSYRTLSERILAKQNYIKETIQSKFGDRNGYGGTTSKSFRCVVDIEDDLKYHVDDIFKPFYEGGFSIINLSEKISSISDENVFLISWKNAFENKNEENEIKENVEETGITVD